MVRSEHHRGTPPYYQKKKTNNPTKCILDMKWRKNLQRKRFISYPNISLMCIFDKCLYGDINPVLTKMLITKLFECLIERTQMCRMWEGNLENHRHRRLVCEYFFQCSFFLFPASPSLASIHLRIHRKHTQHTHNMLSNHLTSLSSVIFPHSMGRDHPSILFIN